MIEQVLFCVFAGFIVLAIGYMICTSNVIHGAYALAIVLLCLAAIFILLNAEYLAVVQIFLYAGGVVVLLVFGIMITNRDKKGAPMTGHRAIFSAGFVSITLCVLMLFVTMGSGLSWSPVLLDDTDQTRAIGYKLLTDHLLAFELIAVLLLSVLVGASFLAKKSTTDE